MAALTLSSFIPPRLVSSLERPAVRLVVPPAPFYFSGAGPGIDSSLPHGRRVSPRSSCNHRASASGLFPRPRRAVPSPERRLRLGNGKSLPPARPRAEAGSAGITVPGSCLPAVAAQAARTRCDRSLAGRRAEGFRLGDLVGARHHGSTWRAAGGADAQQRAAVVVGPPARGVESPNSAVVQGKVGVGMGEAITQLSDVFRPSFLSCVMCVRAVVYTYVYSSGKRALRVHLDPIRSPL